MSELSRRQTEAQIAAAAAQVKAASHSWRMATYMLWSVIAITIAAVVDVIFTLLD